MYSASHLLDKPRSFDICPLHLRDNTLFLKIYTEFLQDKSEISGCYPLYLLVNPRGWEYHPARMLDNTLAPGVIYQAGCHATVSAPRLLDQVRQTLRLKHFSLKTVKNSFLASAKKALQVSSYK